MKITIHLGSTKTGTSALQAHLFKAHQALKKQGILYPEIGVASNAHHLLFAAIHPNAWAMHRAALPESEADRFALFDQMMKNIIAAAEQNGSDHIVLSSEYMWGVLPERFMQQASVALAGHSLRLVAVARRQDLWLEASYLQAVKFGMRAAFADWLPKFTSTPHSGSDYMAVLSGWESVVHPVETHVMPYEFADRTAFTRQVANLVCDHDVARAVVPMTAQVANPSPTADGLATLLSDKRTPAAEGDLWRPAGTRETFLFSPDEQRDVLQRYRSTNQALARRFRPDGPPEFFDLSDLD